MVASRPIAEVARVAMRRGGVVVLIVALSAAIAFCAGPALAQSEMVYTPPPAPPTALPDLPCETPQDRAMFEDDQADWADAYKQAPQAEDAVAHAQKAIAPREEEVKQALKALDAAWAAYNQANADLKAGRSGTQASVKQSFDAVRRAIENESIAYAGLHKAQADLDWAQKNLSDLLSQIRRASDAWWALIADINKRKCAAPPQPQAAQPPTPPPVGNPPPAPVNPKAPAPPAKTKCPACEKLDQQIAAIDAKIASLERSNASLGQGNAKDPKIQNAIQQDEQKISDLKAQRKKLEDQKTKCQQACAPQTTNEGSLAAAPAPQPAAPSPSQEPAQTRTASAFESAVLQEINHARTDPTHYSLISARYPPAAVEVGRSFLRNAMPITPLQLDDRLSIAASVQAADQGPKGQDSHTGSDGSTPMQRIGVWSMMADEVISVGQSQAAGVVAQLIIDPPDTLHLHRGVLFDPMMTSAGVACGPNAKFAIMCVIDLAGAPAPRD